MRALSLVSVAIIAATAAAPARAQINWAGGYLGPVFGYAVGTAEYVFATDGHYNNNPGDTFQHGVAGMPIGAALGYNWQNGTIVLGLESAIYSAVRGISNYHVPNPFEPTPNSQFVDLKGHWFTSLTPRIGITRGPALFYVQAGPAYGHLVWVFTDNAAGIHIPSTNSAVGFAAGIGVELMDPDRRYSIDLGYQYLGLLPVRAAIAESVTNPGGVPVPNTGTDHTIGYRTHALMVSVNYFATPAEPGQGNLPGLIDWRGPYLTFVTGPPLREFGGGFGFNVTRGRLLLGAETFAFAITCCDVDLELMANARLGVILDQNIVVYAESGFAHLWGTFWDIFGGPSYNAGFGVEVALGPSASGFMEMKHVGAIGSSGSAVNWMGGINLHLGGRR